MPASWKENRPARRSGGRPRSRPRLPAAPRAGPDPAAAGSHGGRAGHHGQSTRALGGHLQERGCRAQATEALMNAYTGLTSAGTSTRAASALTGVARATAARRTAKPAPPTPRHARAANRLSRAECDEVLATLNSDEFVDTTPTQVYATLLDRGVYLCSVATMYRILRANAQVAERRRQARHPARTVPELVATGPRQVYT